MFEAAVRHHQAGRLVEAEQLYRTILTADPRHAASLHLLGLIAHADGRYDTAVEWIGQAIRLREDFFFYHYSLANALKALGRTDDAIAHYERALALNPDFADGHNNLGNVLAAQGRTADAMAHYERALVLNPNHANAHNNLGILLVARGMVADGQAHYERALVLDPDYADAHNNLGVVLADQGKLDDAMAHYQRVLAINPDHIEVHNNLGNLFKEQGSFDEALVHYARAIERRPDYAEAHFNRVEITTFHPGDSDLAALETLAAREDLPEYTAVHIHFALAKALDDCGDYTRAFEHLRGGNALKRRQINYNEANSIALFQRISTVFDRRLFDRFQGAGDPSTVPVFVLGMPRSGSTLIEQILASHPQIHGAGELPVLEILVAGLSHATEQPVPYPESVPAMDGAALLRLGQSYLAGLPAVADGKVRIVDKLSGNFLSIGLIRLILPNARIIHTMRDPLDTCVSCFSRLFASGLAFTYDLAELGRYYRRYRELMAHWRSVLPPDAMLDVSYEDVVGDLEGQARRLIDYCGLPWDDRCLSFHGTRRPVRTASAAQVRKPLFRTSLERWRKYEAGLAPLLRELAPVKA
jgi:tetratricopeptide (TPR) repeat protein